MAAEQVVIELNQGDHTERVTLEPGQLVWIDDVYSLRLVKREGQ